MQHKYKKFMCQSTFNQSIIIPIFIALIANIEM